MFYPTVEGRGPLEIAGAHQRFLLLRREEWGSQIALAKEAFLEIIATRNAMGYQKLKMLEGIVSNAPVLLRSISHKEMISALRQLRDHTRERGELISTPELEWITRFLRGKKVRSKAESIIYGLMLLGSDRWDRHRRQHKWVLSVEKRQALIREAVHNPHLSAKRRAELGREIGEPCEEAERAYFCRLLFDRHYDKARELNLRHTEEDILRLVLCDLENSFIKDALDILRIFLPNRLDLIAEVEKIKEVLWAG